jgi:beta-galactosidase
VLLNEDWKFFGSDTSDAEQREFKDSAWKKIDLPHTWNVEDTQDDVPGYRMGIGWYRKLIKLSEQFKGKRLFLYFEGANQVAEVFVNGKFVGRHEGGYTAFVFDVTSFVTFDSANNENTIAVKVDNSSNENLPPSPTADFNLYGGIYRDVWLVATDSVHFTMLDYASAGVYVDTPDVSAESATARTRGQITNNSRQTRRLRVVNTVLDGIGETVAVGESKLSVEGGAEAAFQQGDLVIRKPHLWSPDTPYLYSLRTQLFDGEKLLDQITNPLGFRWFSFHPDLGFFLNGNRYKLHGANRHQDYFGLGNAVRNEIQVRDLALMKELGLNCVLLAHYPQDPAVLEAADQIGLLVWEELPIVREISTSNEFASNCQVMLTEMIRQHHNHPSIIMWCLMNEVFLKLHYEPGYVLQVVALARTLNELAHREDPTRVTAISANRPYDDTDIYNASGLLNIPQVVGWHMYFGWYYEDFAGLGKFLDDEHRRFPNRNLFVSEYGADYDARLHALHPMRGDLSADWAQLYHQSYVPQLEARPYLAGSAIWAQNDFGSEARGESFPHINTKGLFTFDRRPKDIYYFYEATFSSAPVLHIATHDWLNRTGSNPEVRGPHGKRGQPKVVQPVSVYTNLSMAELFVNKVSLGVKSVGSTKLVTWNVPFQAGLNTLEARGRIGGRELRDRADVRFLVRPSTLADPLIPFRELAVNVGSTSQYIDAAGLVWDADQPYSSGSWGYTGGAPANTAKNILGSADDPLYQTLLQGLDSYRFDVANGRYEVELRFAEPYFEQPGERVFSVSLNGKPVIANLDLVRSYGALRAGAQTFPVDAAHGQGVTVQFSASRGEPVLSAVRIRKLP